jgi:hypothetical protein
MTGILLLIRTFLSANGFLVAACMGALALFWTYDSSRVQRGKEIERAQTQKANKQAASVADSVRAKSRSPGVRGPIDPNFID